MKTVVGRGPGAEAGAAAVSAGPHARLPVHSLLANLSSMQGSAPERLGELQLQRTYLALAEVHEASYWHSPMQLAVVRGRAGEERLATCVAEIPAG
jgi:hypothetical protein